MERSTCQPETTASHREDGELLEVEGTEEPNPREN
jgi:hypothetical protein